MDTRRGGGRRLAERLTGTPRLVLAVALLALGALVALTATTPPASGPVVVATRALPAGAVLAAADLTVTRQPVDTRPEGVLTDTAPALGRRVVGAVARGEVVTRARLAPEGFASGLAAGRAVATVAVAASRVGVVVPGDTVRLVARAATDDAGAVSDLDPVTLTADARVLAVWAGDAGADAATLVVDVDVGSASRLAVLPPDLLVGCVIVTA